MSFFASRLACGQLAAQFLLHLQSDPWEGVQLLLKFLHQSVKSLLHPLLYLLLVQGASN